MKVFVAGATGVVGARAVVQLLAGAGPARFYPALTQKLAGRRAEPLTRSQRVDSARFTAVTGWTPRSRSTCGGWSEHPSDAGA